MTFIVVGFTGGQVIPNTANLEVIKAMTRANRAHQRGQASLIGMLITLAIILVLAATLYPQIAARHSEPGGTATPTERSYGTACAEYESQMNQAVFMYKGDHEDHAPRSLEQLKPYGVSDDMIHAEGCYFQIDPASGHVSDVGHGKYVPVNPPASAMYRGRATGFHPDGPSTRTAPTPAPAPAPYVPAPAPYAPPAPAPQGGNGGTIGPGGVRIPNMSPAPDPSTADPGSP